MRRGQRTFEKGSFFFRILDGDFWSGKSLLDDASLHHWSRMYSHYKKKQLLKLTNYFQRFISRSWEYFGSSIASKLKSKELCI